MLYLSNSQVREIIGDDHTWVVDVMHKMFETLGKGHYALGGLRNASHGLRMPYPRDGGERLFVAMPAHLGDPFDVTGVKWYGPNLLLPGMNTDIHFILILNDVNTGIPFAVMPANFLSTMRTACVSAAAARVLVKDAPSSLGIVGPGKINTVVAEALINIYPSITNIVVKGRGLASRDLFVAHIREHYPGIDTVLAESVKDVVTASDIVSLNTGFVFDDFGDMPTIRASWVRPNQVFLCSSFAHFPDSVLLGGSTKICDLFAQYESYEDELKYPAYKTFGTIGNRFADLIIEGKLDRSDIYDISEIISGSRLPSNDHDLPAIFSSGGLAVEDIALGIEIYKRAVERNIGTVLEF